MKHPESKMNDPLQAWLRGKDCEVYVEVPDHRGMRKFDLVGLHSDDSMIIVEMKTSLTDGLIQQAVRGLWVTDNVYCAVASDPRGSGIERCKEKGLGVLRVQGEAVIELLSPSSPSTRLYLLTDWITEKVRSRLDRMESGGVGGLPNQKGIGPAQAVEKLILEYKKKNPKATWVQMFLNIPNHYVSANSMAGAMRRVVERRLMDRRLEEARKSAFLD